jgi:hypothetical protein
MRRVVRRAAQAAAFGAGAAALLTLPVALEARLKRATRPLTDEWQRLPIEPRGETLLGMSFRSPQVDALGLDARATLHTLLSYPFQLIRLGAYWNRIEPEPGAFQTAALDWQIDAAERAGKQIILCLGPLKTFGYPEFFVPAHRLQQPFPEHTRITPSAYPSLLAAATDFIARLVERYRQHESIVAWQLEHEAVDPLGVEHSWRMDASFVAKEAEAVRATDPNRPLMMNGFLAASLPVLLSQWWQTRDQGDSLAIAERMADIIGIDYYPRHAVMALGSRTLYLDGSRGSWQQRRWKRLLARAHARGQKVMVAEGQAEPWEAVTTPPNPDRQGMYSCLPQHVIENYNACMRRSQHGASLYAYLFWGAEYWLVRQQSGDLSYMQAFARLLDQA